MKKKEKEILAFPAPPPEPAAATVAVQIGSERFAIYFEIEDLPPAPPTPAKLLELKESAKKRQRIH